MFLWVAVKILDWYEIIYGEYWLGMSKNEPEVQMAEDWVI